MPNVPEIAVFDTAFFARIPEHVYTYAVPYSWYQKHGIRRYGFHGTSHLYVSRRTASLMGKDPSEVNVITLHIGNGVSVTAVKKGLAFDHSMGFTPLEGAVMGTRCGDIDPAIPLYMIRKLGIAADDMARILNKQSGLLGVTGRHADRRDIIKASEQGDQRCKLAIEMECYRLKKYVGAYTAAMGRLDAVAFTGGVGEKSPIHRAKICENLETLGIRIDPIKNQSAVAREADVGDTRYSVRVFAIPTNEELVIAEDAYAILEGTYDEYSKFEYVFQNKDFRLTPPGQPT